MSEEQAEQPLINTKDIEAEMEKIIPALRKGMPLVEAMLLILNELKRLKEIESKYQGLMQ